MLKSGTTVEQTEKRIRARPRVAETFLRGRGKDKTRPHTARPQQRGPGVPPPRAPARPPLRLLRTLREQQRRPCLWSPRPGREQSPAPRGAAPRNTRGCLWLPPTHCGAAFPHMGTGGRSVPAHGSAHAAPPFRRWSFRGAAATAPPAGPGTHQLLCVFHQALMGRNRLLPLRARPRGLGAPSARGWGWGRGRQCRDSPGNSAAPSTKDRLRPPGHQQRDGQVRRRGHAPARIGLRGAAPLPYPPHPGRNHSLPGVSAPHQSGHRGG